MNHVERVVILKALKAAYTWNGPRFRRRRVSAREFAAMTAKQRARWDFSGRHLAYRLAKAIRLLEEKGCRR